MTSQQLMLTLDADTFRRVTMTELKRIMGFRDDYIFEGGKTAAAKQLGNAVCPQVSRAIARGIQVREQRYLNEQSLQQAA